MELRRALSPSRSPRPWPRPRTRASSCTSYLASRRDGELPGRLLRGAARELGRYPDWRLRWFERARRFGRPGRERRARRTRCWTCRCSASRAATSSSRSCTRRRSPAPRRGCSPAWSRARSTWMRPGARSPASRPGRCCKNRTDYAPYGWSHCLTLPQAVMGIAGDGLDAHRAVAVASTYIVGFRAALGQRALDPEWEPDPPGTRSLAEALPLGPDAAAAAVWHAPADCSPRSSPSSRRSRRNTTTRTW